ncbi:MAG: glycosyltransferase [Anaerolineales bacterium]|nr:glycosyltransferase [Anaerolineales bacterium]
MKNRLTFVFLSTTDWDAPQFGSRQQIALELARRGHRLLFIEVPRALHSFISDPTGTRQALHRMGKIRWIDETLAVYTPRPVLPIYYHPVSNWVNQRLLVRDVQRALKLVEWQADVVWTYWANTAVFLHHFQHQGATAVYHCIDDFTAVSYPFVSSQTIARMEIAQCQATDIIFARTQALTERLRQHNPRCTRLPGGVDVERFDPERVTAAADITQLPHPIAGFVGTIDNRVDVPLLAACAARLPHVSFVLVGPVKQYLVDIRPLKQLSNVYFFPAVPFEQVPEVIAAFDAGLIPYQVNRYTNGLSPIKLYEYLAMAKPVTATRLPYLEREAAHIALADDADGFVKAVKTAVSTPPTSEQKAAWRQVAEENAWYKQVDTIENMLLTKHG